MFSERLSAALHKHQSSQQLSRLATVAVAAGLLAACGAGNTTSTGPAKDADPASVTGTLRVLTPSYGTSTVGKQSLQKVIDTFHKTYPKVKVEADNATFDNLNQKISTALAGGQGYDVYVTGIGWIPPFASKGLYTDLSKFGFTKDTLSKDYSSALYNAVQYQGKIYGVPLMAAPKLVAYRKSMFKQAGLDPEKPPTTWAELRSYAKKLTKRSGSGELQRAGLDFWSGPGALTQPYVSFLGSLGGTQYSADGKPAFNDAKGVKAAEFVTELIKKDKVTDFGYVSNDNIPLVLKGKAAMGFAGGYIDCSEKTGVGQDVCDDLGFFNITESKPAMFTGGQVASVAANSKLQAASYKFVQVMSSLQAESDMAKLNFAVPARQGATADDPAGQFALKNLQYAVFQGGSTGYLDTRIKFGPALDEIVLGKKSAKPALDALAQDER
ncbi:extracellular solute-binding protein [Streptomyces shenzhenensis]|uniref:extracellular solute-binding protein n=1 Tax=Streptomyces shenzhenensis TaxID=943815 RepID=UPI0015F0AC19|nr:extracellular solute-binding protein [Streptomyces shenzhenensis]